MLIYDEFLVVGSQNLHYSAFGGGALTEYSLGVTDPQAIEDYQRMFDYMWDRAIQ
jgi:cardiolipin synthase